MFYLSWDQTIQSPGFQLNLLCNKAVKCLPLIYRGRLAFDVNCTKGSYFHLWFVLFELTPRFPVFGSRDFSGLTIVKACHRTVGFCGL